MHSFKIKMLEMLRRRYRCKNHFSRYTVGPKSSPPFIAARRLEASEKRESEFWTYGKPGRVVFSTVACAAPSLDSVVVVPMSSPSSFFFVYCYSYIFFVMLSIFYFKIM